MKSFLQFICELNEDATPAHSTGSRIDNYDPVMKFHNIQRRKTWLRRKKSKQQTDAKIAESTAEYQEVRRQHYGATK
jgi:hypothetical protein